MSNSTLVNPFISTPRCLLASVLGIAFGSVMFVEWLPNFAVRNSPIVLGTVVARVPILQWGVPRTDFTIQLDNANVQVHARTQRYLMHQVPALVRFRYSGNPQQEVFLYEHEEDPFWIMVVCWAASAGLLALVFHRWWQAGGEAADWDNTIQNSQVTVTRIERASS